jgi:hypothetical protein
MSRLIEFLGGEGSVKAKAPLAFQVLSVPETVQTEWMENTLLKANGSGSFYNDDTFDTYMDIEQIFSDTGGIQSLLKGNFARKATFLAVVADVYDAKSGKLIDTFAYYYENVGHNEHRIISDSIMAKSAAKSDIRVKASFTWTEDGKTAKERNITYTASQFVDEQSIIESVEVTAPRAKNKQMTKMVYDRAKQIPDFDYGYTGVLLSGNKAKLMMPFAGKITVPSNFEIVGIESPDPEDTPKLVINLLDGSNAEYNNPVSFVEQFIQGISEDKHSLTWEMMDKDADGKDAKDGKDANKPKSKEVKDKDDWCTEIDLSHFNKTTIVDLSCSFRLHVVDPRFPLISHFPRVMINSVEKAEIKGNGVCEIERITIFWGCVAGNTMIAIADGSEKRARDIRAGDMLRTDAGNADVRDVITGYEAEIVVLTTQSGHELKATGSHPVSTARGFVKLSEINAADIIMTVNGESPVKHLYTEKYNDQVYNFILEPSRAIICGGIIAGDFMMQNTVHNDLAKKDNFNPTPLVLEMRKLFGKH